MIGLILDHNGVICQGDDFYKERSQRIAKIFNIAWSEDVMHFWRKIYIEASLGKLSLRDYYTKLSEAFSVKLNGDEDDKFVGMEKLIPQIPDVLKEIRRNHNVKLALMSNYVDRWVYKFLVDRNLKKYFHAVVVSSAIGIRKPYPEAFRIAAGEIGVPLANCIYVGDTVVDLEACRKMGVRPVFIPGEEADPKGFESIKSVEELPKIIK